MAVYHFADFELDEELRQLRLRCKEVPLQPRAFAVLAYLIKHRTRVVDKDELLEAAAVHLRLAEALRRLEDPEGAALELDSAQSVFSRNRRDCTWKTATGCEWC